jgi:hypothetical protein
MLEENQLRGVLTNTHYMEGQLGFKGERGYSNYDLYVLNGGTMTEQEWLDHFGVDLTGYAKTSEVDTKDNAIKADIGDIDNLTTTDKTDVVSAINEHQVDIETLDGKTTPMYCVASTTSSSAIASNFFVPLDYIFGKNGNFTLQDGGVKIGAGINVIKVSGNIFIDENPTSPSYVWGKIFLIRGNNQSVIATTINSAGNCSFMSTPIPTSLIGVQEGDIIKLMADCGSGGKIRPYVDNTWLFVEKVA